MNTSQTLGPAALSAFAATLSSLPKEEIQKAKKLFILNAIADFGAQRSSTKAFLIVMGVLSIVPVFLVVFIPALIGYRSTIKAERQKILNAIEVWKDDLGESYHEIVAKLGD